MVLTGLFVLVCSGSTTVPVSFSLSPVSGVLADLKEMQLNIVSVLIYVILGVLLRRHLSGNPTKL